ncbi:MAG: IgGFc binding protein [Bacteroidota bacterium]|jgi:hypothetical protein
MIQRGYKRHTSANYPRSVSFPSMRYICTILAMLSICYLPTTAETDTAPLTTGTHFVVGFIHPDRAAGEYLRDTAYCVIVTSRFRATVNVGSRVYQTVPDQPLVVYIPAVDQITVSSDMPIQVASRQLLEGNGEQSWHIPVSSWGTEYRAFAWWTDRHGLDSSAIFYSTAKRRIMAAYDDTRVTVETLHGIIDSVLQAGESWLVSEQLDTAMLRMTSSDPTGLAIRASKPIGVVSGHSKAAVLAYPDALPASGPYARSANRCRGNLHDAMLPVSMAGTMFVTVPIIYTPTRDRGLDLRDQGIGDDRGDVVRFIALEDSTTITATTSKSFDTVVTIDKGQTWLASRVEEPTLWQTSRPALCAQYGKSYGHITSQATRPEDDPSTDAGMPLLMAVPDVRRWVNHATVYSPLETFNAISVVTLTSSIDSVRIDGKALTSLSRPSRIDRTPYSTITVIVPGGTHHVSANSGTTFGCWTYGSLDGYQLGRIYGSSAGFDLRTACDDSLVIDLVYSSGMIKASVGIESSTDPCSKLALLYVDQASNVSWQRNQNVIDISQSDVSKQSSGEVVAVTTSGRLKREPFVLSTTSTSHADELHSLRAQYVRSTNEIVIDNLFDHIGATLSLYSLQGECYFRAVVSHQQHRIPIVNVAPGLVIVHVNNSVFHVTVL